MRVEANIRDVGAETKPVPGLDPEIVQKFWVRKANPVRKSRLMTWGELKALPPPKFLIDGILPEGLSRLYGDPGKGKTFVALDWALNLVKAGKPVVYVVGESPRGIPPRIQAWLSNNDQKDELMGKFLIHNGPVDMLNPDAVGAFIADIQNREFKPELVVLDTLARCFDGGDENLTKDMGKFIRHCDRLQAELGCSVLVLHHTGKNAEKGGRGSSAGLGAVDCDIALGQKRNGPLLLSNTKMKDWEEFPAQRVELVKRYGSCVVEFQLQSQSAKTATVTKQASQAEGLLFEAEPLSETEWHKRFIKAGISHGTPESQNKAFKRAVENLLETGRVQLGPDGYEVIV